MYGDGSDGPLNVTTTHSLALDTKHQFTTVNVASGATLQGIGDGAVLYICATESITINGNLYAGSTAPGQRNVSVTINGETFTSPSVANGGRGGHGAFSAVGGNQGAGFGGGGTGGGVDYSPWGGPIHRGGHGGTGGYPAGSGGASHTSGSGVGNSGGTSGGGGGAIHLTDGGVSSGRGGHAYGGHGQRWHTTIAFAGVAGEGGGAGGAAAVGGIHIVLQAPVINIGSSAVVTTRVFATRNGGNGGDGSDYWGGGYETGSGGGGGGGANAGNLYLRGQSISHSSATYGMTGGAGGLGGTGYQPGLAGSAGSDGQVILMAPPRKMYPAKRWTGTGWHLAYIKASTASGWKEPIIDALD